jgi:hypothetical protein
VDSEVFFRKIPSYQQAKPDGLQEFPAGQVQSTNRQPSFAGD